MSSMTDSQKLDEIYIGLVESSTPDSKTKKKKWIWDEIWEKVCSIFTNLGKVWNHVQKIAKDVGDILSNILGPIPDVYHSLENAMGGVEAGIGDAAKLISGIKTDQVTIAQGHDTLAEIEKALDELLVAAKMDGKVTNPMTKLRQTMSSLSGDMVQGLFGAMNTHAPDWRSIPEHLRDGRQLVLAHHKGDNVDSWFWATTLVVLTATRSAIAATTDVFPVAMGTGVIGGASLGIELEFKIDVKPVAVGKIPVFVIPALETAHEVISLCMGLNMQRALLESHAAQARV